MLYIAQRFYVFFKSHYFCYSLWLSTLVKVKSSLKHFYYEYFFKFLYSEKDEKFKWPYQYVRPYTSISIMFSIWIIFFCLKYIKAWFMLLTVILLDLQLSVLTHKLKDWRSCVIFNEGLFIRGKVWTEVFVNILSYKIFNMLLLLGCLL